MNDPNDNPNQDPDQNPPTPDLPNPDPTDPHEAERSHGHDEGRPHGHHDDDPLHPHVGAPVDTEGMDPASRSLNDALRISFTVLKFVIIALLIALALSGTHNVEEGRVAVRLLFGAIQGDPGERVLQPGGPYFWPPEPIGRFIEVDTTLQQVSLDEAFWFALRPGQQMQRLEEMQGGGPLVPGIDGSLLTADKNIVHGRWTINYHVEGGADAVNFIRNVSAAQDVDEMREQARQVVRFAAERAIVHGVAQVPAEDFVSSVVDREMIRQLIQRELESLNSGITVTQVQLDQSTPPLAVRGAFRAVSQAQSERARKIEQARQQASTILNEAAGAGYRQLLDAIDAYEEARLRGNQQAIAQADATISNLLNSEAVTGRVSEIISAARLYEQSHVSEVQAEAEQFQRLLPEFRANPRIVLNRRWQDTLQRILGGQVESFYLPATEGKTLYLEVNPDPRIQQRRETQAYLQQQQQRAQDARMNGGSAGPPMGP